ncbi:MAG: hypothetical protein HY322_13935 [Betaproteobacteria bacterium]|nr:hypothetical protein [Betaproteobacteria bacterium]
MAGGTAANHLADAHITTNVANALASGIEAVKSAPSAASGANMGFACDWIMSSAAPVMKPTTTG